ncbi:MAG TPA: hypothetical protein VMP13_07735 [Acidimicrobiia bacterium]|nr:hypothetical protein [Acidimicrobiia bacterium]
MRGRPLIVVAALALVACNGAGDETVSSPADLAADVGCLTCHTETSTTIAPTLHGIWGTDVELVDGRVVTVDEEYVRRAIADPTADVVAGYGPTMPRLPLDESEVDRLVEWVRSLG